MQERDDVILFRILAFILKAIGKPWKGLKQRHNMIKFSFEKYESDCSECRSLLLQAISAHEVGDDGYSSWVGEKVIDLKFLR